MDFTTVDVNSYDTCVMLGNVMALNVVCQRGLYNYVRNHVLAFSTWRIRKPEVVIYHHLRHLQDSVKGYFTVSAHDKSDGMYANSM